MRAIRGSAFRLALLYSVLFVVSSSVLLLLSLWWTTRALLREVDVTIDAEIARLSVEYRTGGVPGLVNDIRERLGSRQVVGETLYMLVDAEGRTLIGNLTALPGQDADAEGRVTFPVGNFPDLQGTARRARARLVRLGDGLSLAVGRDLVYLDLLRARLVGGLGWGITITVLISLIGGVLISRSANRRIATLNHALDEVMRGDLLRRLPVRGNDDEIDELIGHVNGMLDRIGELMANVRQVSNNIAHDLRTPLTRLRRRLDEVVVSGDLRPDQHAAVMTAATEADALLSTFNALLRIARIEASDRRSGFDSVDLVQTARDVVELYEPLAEETNRGLGAESLPEALTSHGDRDLLFQALANLVDNALKYTPEGGAVRVSLVPGERTADLVVEDDGPGIPPAQRERVLDRFVRLDESRSTAGNGLGLALVDAVARLHHGSVLVEDADPGARIRLRIALG